MRAAGWARRAALNPSTASDGSTSLDDRPRQVRSVPVPQHAVIICVEDDEVGELAGFEAADEMTEPRGVGRVERGRGQRLGRQQPCMMRRSARI